MTAAKNDKVPEVGLRPLSADEARAKDREDARKRIAYIFVWFYVALVLINVALPTILFIGNQPAEGISMSDLKDLSATIAGVMAGLVGILGFVVGYYFKSADDGSFSRRPIKK